MSNMDGTLFNCWASGRETSVHAFRFETNSTSAPDGLIDPGGVVSSVARSDTGDYLVTLNKRYKRIVYASANYAEADLYDAHVQGFVEGSSAANTLTVTVRDLTSSGAATDTTDKTIQVVFVTSRVDSV